MNLFGFPLSGPASNAITTTTYLRTVWTAVYRQASSDNLNEDLALCRRFSDPLVRGQTLRERISELAETPAPPRLIGSVLAEPILIDLDARHRLVGIEGRLLIDALQSATVDERYVISDAIASSCVDLAYRTYRTWSLQRLVQVSDLRAGRGREPMQLKAVGLVLALLINRSTSAERAITPEEQGDTAVGAERAVFAGAEAFAASLNDRGRRSPRQDRLKGGYAITEARRRLPDLRITTSEDSAATARYFLAPSSEAQVLTSLAAELRRRRGLNADTVAAAFDALVGAFRTMARLEAWRGGFHERPANTASIRAELLQQLSQPATGEADG